MNFYRIYFNFTVPNISLYLSVYLYISKIFILHPLTRMSSQIISLLPFLIPYCKPLVQSFIIFIKAPPHFFTYFYCSLLSLTALLQLSFPLYAHYNISFFYPNFHYFICTLYTSLLLQFFQSNDALSLFRTFHYLCIFHCVSLLSYSDQACQFILFTCLCTDRLFKLCILNRFFFLRRY